MLHRLWTCHPSLSPYYLLHFGNQLKDNDLIGAAYYQIVLRGEAAWQMAEPGLSEPECRRLADTRVRLAEQWQELFNAIGKGGTKATPLYHPCCWSARSSPYHHPPTNFDWLHTLCKDLALSDTPYYDFIGKVEIVISSARKHCNAECSKRYTIELNDVKKRLYRYHQIEDVMDAN
ncbi:hypothetical protein DL93DRAFT_1904683 [Clavulina sp. PMI_390]|nr:hypothetical protein DL93DRAFT_1904683 [Clavulina sp. PMI_390]